MSILLIKQSLSLIENFFNENIAVCHIHDLSVEGIVVQYIDCCYDTFFVPGWLSGICYYKVLWHFYYIFLYHSCPEVCYLMSQLQKMSPLSATSSEHPVTMFWSNHDNMGEITIKPNMTIIQQQHLWIIQPRSRGAQILFWSFHAVAAGHQVICNSIAPSWLRSTNTLYIEDLSVEIKSISTYLIYIWIGRV